MEWLGINNLSYSLRGHSYNQPFRMKDIHPTNKCEVDFYTNVSHAELNSIGLIY